MKWLEIAATSFDEALDKSEGVVLIPIGSIEVHGPHLPVGCDTLIVERLVEMVAEHEPVVVAPVMAYTMAPMARLHPGGISLPPELLVEHLQKVCDELARNGFRKIILVHAHGGNVPIHHKLCKSLSKRSTRGRNAPRDDTLHHSGPGKALFPIQRPAPGRHKRCNC